MRRWRRSSLRFRVGGGGIRRKLNFGDCMAYGGNCRVCRGMRLLFTGEDWFGKTDIRRRLRMRSG